ncbi:hypothetical protein [Anaerorhabdus furcosa]|uniref:Uncharacterized protein n=1 Tax=Anaerorhabdus furcosa TaxID=118967 RepID=A0A1T4ND72_9FIRM|nr:hypothetical protein [Anaerorhabdus furcosa]SJZ76996.1 hypothetical protein SAMN02745191_1571 [Anaerorhabdus furcosa]
MIYLILLILIFLGLLIFAFVFKKNVRIFVSAAIGVSIIIGMFTYINLDKIQIELCTFFGKNCELTKDREDEIVEDIMSYMRDARYLNTINYINGLSKKEQSLYHVNNLKTSALNSYLDLVLNEAKDIANDKGYKETIDFLKEKSNLYDDKSKIEDKIKEYTNLMNEK